MGKKKFLENINKFFVQDKKANLVNIYFIVCDQHKKHDYLNRVKIGYAKDVHARIAAMQTGNPTKLRPWYTFQVESYRAKELEADLHHKFKWSRTGGEWFRKHGAIREWIQEHRKINQCRGKVSGHVLRKNNKQPM